MTGVFLQVRLDSSRLPRKALLPLAGLPVIQHAVNALSHVKADMHMLLTTDDSADELAPVAEKSGWGVFIGPKEDVLDRYILAARKTGCSRIIRATGDNPLVSAEMADEAVRIAEESGSDYTGFLGMPLGSGVEVIKTQALEEAWKDAKDPYERAHVAPFLYRHPERFKIVRPEAPEKYHAPETRITLDTREDYLFLQKLFADLYRGNPLSLSELVPWLKANSGNEC